MPAIDPQVLLEEAKCYACYANASLAELLKLALLSRIAQAGGGGGPQTPWTSDIYGGCFNLNNVCKTNGVGVYRALLAQSGTDAPVATVLENTLGGTVALTRTAVGTYELTLVGAFPETRTFHQPLYTDFINNLVAAQITRGSDDIMTVLTADISAFPASVPSDSILSMTSVEILVYPATPQCPDCAT